MGKNINYWYVARPNELFIDTDNVSRSIKHTKARLQGAIECGKLNVAYIMQRQSKSKNHIHTIITLKNEIVNSYERFAWEMILHGDIYRAACNIMRLANYINAPDVLISPNSEFHHLYDPSGEDKNFARHIRKADDECECKSKHNAATMKTCPAAKRLRGEFRAVGFFGKPSKNPCTIWPED